MNEETFKPTLSSPSSKQSANVDKSFKPVLRNVSQLKEDDGYQELSEEELNEIDNMLNEKEQSLKKKIFSLPKMEALVFSDPKLIAAYDEMAVNGSEKFGYHYNETIHNILFNDYVLNSAKYLQKYKMAIPKVGGRRDKSGINQLKKIGQKKMGKTGTNIIEPDLSPKSPEVVETTGAASSGAFSPAMGIQNKSLGISETTTASSAGGSAGYVGYAGPAAWSKKGDLSKDFKMGNKNIIDKPMYVEGKIVDESKNYLINPNGFEKMVQIINEQMDRTDANNLVTDKTTAFNSQTIKNWNKNDMNTELDTLKTGKMDNANLRTEGLNEIQAGATITTVDQIKALGRKLTKEDIPMLGGEALYRIAISRANRMLPMGWDGLADVNSMWDYIRPNGGMTSEQLTAAVKRAVNKRLKEEGYSLKSLGLGESENIDKEPTKVLFLVHDGGGEDLFAYFPEIVDHGIFKTGYSHVGQHGGVHPEYAKESRLATPDEYQDLMNELQGIGYNLIILNKNNEVFIRETTQSMIDDNETSMVNKPAPVGSQSQGMEMGMNSSGGGMNEDNEVEGQVFNIGDRVEANNGLQPAFYYSIERIFKDKYGDIIYMGFSEDNSQMVQFTDKYLKIANMDKTINENAKIFAELNEELQAFSVHQDKLKRLVEDKKPSSLILKDRLGDDNQKNFKKDFSNSDTKKVIDVQKELQWKDQQTEIGKDAQKLGADIEKKALSGEKNSPKSGYESAPDLSAGMPKINPKPEGDGFKNVGDSANLKGDEIPKRNATEEEVKQVDMYRLGMSDLQYDNLVGKRFEDRMKTDMGDDIYAQRNEKMKFRGEAPMYNKDTQPMEKGDKKEQYNKGLNETMVTGRYYDANGKSHMIDFVLGESFIAEKKAENWSALSFDGLGNSYANKLNTSTHKLDINESVIGTINGNKFYIDENQEVHVVIGSKVLSENVNTKPEKINNIDKMKHLSGYKPSNYTDTTTTRVNRNF